VPAGERLVHGVCHGMGVLQLTENVLQLTKFSKHSQTPRNGGNVLR
jgi:hypothetical protein